ncbi:uncharacterized protein [Penaeus vannamei]|uniref:uncharacterized protein isoform X2 n=1 Tax=Penaeus vannamei TaxID=6689 RepID=UPI00387F91D6
MVLFLALSCLLPGLALTMSVEGRAAPDLSTYNSVGERVQPDLSTYNSVDERVHPDLSTYNSVEERVHPDLSTYNSVDERVRPDLSTYNSVEERVHPDLSTYNVDEMYLRGDTEDSGPVEEPFEQTNPDVVDGKNLFEKDIMLTEAQWEQVLARKGLAAESRRWPEDASGTPRVKYRFADENVDQQAVLAGIAHWETHTCVRFDLITDANQPHLMFRQLSGCWSYIGYLPEYFPRGQNISIGLNCESLGTVAHEIGHSLGWYHEQSRPDRDLFVHVNSQNVQSGRLGNFHKQSDTEVNNQNVPYDLRSVMHYGGTYFSINEHLTLATVDPRDQGLIGKRVGFSHMDILIANRMYHCIDKWLENCGLTADPCQNNGFTGESCTCVCPEGTTGTHCETVTGDYHAAYRSACNELITSPTTISSPNYPNKYPAGVTCAKWIKAPENMIPKVTFTDFRLTACANKWDFLEIRTNDLFDGDFYCENQIAAGTSFVGTSRELILMFYTRSNRGYGWEADVTFFDPSTTTTTTPEPTTTTTPEPTTTTTTPEPTTTTTPEPTTTTTTPEPTTTTTTPEPTTTTTTPEPTTTTTTPEPTTTTTTPEPTTTTTPEPTTTTTTPEPTTTTTPEPTTTTTTPEPTTTTTTPEPTTTTTTPEPTTTSTTPEPTTTTTTPEPTTITTTPEPTTTTTTPEPTTTTTPEPTTTTTTPEPTTTTTPDPTTTTTTPEPTTTTTTPEPTTTTTTPKPTTTTTTPEPTTTTTPEPTTTTTTPEPTTTTTTPEPTTTTTTPEPTTTITTPEPTTTTTTPEPTTTTTTPEPTTTTTPEPTTTTTTPEPTTTTTTPEPTTTTTPEPTTTTTTPEPTTTTTTPEPTTTAPEITTTGPTNDNASCTLYSFDDKVDWTSPYFGVADYPNDFKCGIVGYYDGPLMAKYTFNTFQLEGKSRRRNELCHDYVDIPIPYSRSMRFCGSQTGYQNVPNFRFSTEFVTDSSITDVGYNISISWEITECHTVIQLSKKDSRGTISSPNYPSDYPDQAACEWWIVAPAGKKVTLQFRDVQVNNPDCEAFYIAVDRSGSGNYLPENSDLICSEIKKLTLTSDAETMNVAFYGRAMSNAGFTARYRMS